MKTRISFVLVATALMFAFAACENKGNEPSGSQKISLSETSITLDKGQEKQLTATADPAGTITWSSSNNAVATVSNSGLVVAIGEGSATITAKIGSASANCAVQVNGSSITDPSLTGSNYYLFSLAETYAAKLKSGAIAKDYRVNDTDVEFQIWTNEWSSESNKCTLTEATRIGDDYYGGSEEWFCLKQSAAAWNDGNGPIGAAGWLCKNGCDLTGTDDSYTFYCKYKNSDNAKIWVGFYETGAQPTYIQLPATSTGQWVVYEKSLKDMGLSFSESFKSEQNVFSIKMESAQVSTMNIGAAFIYKK